METTEDFKSDRINFESTLYKGCTLNELIILASLSFGISIIGLVLSFLIFFGAALVGLAFAIPLGFGLMLLSATCLGSLKQNKPQGYHQQSLMLWLEDHGLFSSVFIRRSGKWSVKRGDS